MKIAYCIPTRGKAEYLDAFVPGLLKRSYMPETKIIIGWDRDLEDWLDTTGGWKDDPRVVHSYAAREDSLGAKYNRIAAACPGADLYVMAVDDIGIETAGWDIMLDAMWALVPDRIACFTWGREPNGEPIPSMFGLTRRFIELQGFMAPPHFPFWWHNTWVWEVGELAGRLIPVDIKVQYPKALPPSPRRDVAFWGKFFDESRGLRVRTAMQMIAESDDQPWRKWLLSRQLQTRTKVQVLRNSPTRNPSFEAIMNAAGTNIPEPIDDRHRRLKEAALRLLESLDRGPVIESPTSETHVAEKELTDGKAA